MSRQQPDAPQECNILFLAAVFCIILQLMENISRCREFDYDGDGIAPILNDEKV